MDAPEHASDSSSSEQGERQAGGDRGAQQGVAEGCTPGVLGLPEGALSRVLDCLDGRSLLRAGAVCRKLRRAVWDGPGSSSLQRWRRVCEADLETAVFALFEQALEEQEEEVGREGGTAGGGPGAQVWSGARFWGNVWGAQFVGSAAGAGAGKRNLTTQGKGVESVSKQESAGEAGEGATAGSSEGTAEWASTELWLEELEAGPGGAPRVHRGPDGRSALVVECRFCKEQEVVLLRDNAQGSPAPQPCLQAQAQVQAPLPRPPAHHWGPRGGACAAHPSLGMSRPSDASTSTDTTLDAASASGARAAAVAGTGSAAGEGGAVCDSRLGPESRSGASEGAAEGPDAAAGEASSRPRGWRWFSGGARQGYDRGHSRWYRRGWAGGEDVESGSGRGGGGGGGGGGDSMGGEGVGERLLGTRHEGDIGPPKDIGGESVSGSGQAVGTPGAPDVESALGTSYGCCPAGSGDTQPPHAQSLQDRGGGAEEPEGWVRIGEGRAGGGTQEGGELEAGLRQWEGGGLLSASGMVRPCQCGGSMACLHLSCLQRWIERRRMDGQLSEAALRCEVCLQPYRVRVEEKLDLSWARLCSHASISFYAEFCTIAATLASMAFLFVVAFAGRHQPQQQDGSGLVALYTSLLVVGSVFILGCFTLARLMSRWRGALCVPLLSPEASALCSP